MGNSINDTFNIDVHVELVEQKGRGIEFEHNEEEQKT